MGHRPGHRCPVVHRLATVTCIRAAFGLLLLACSAVVCVVSLAGRERDAPPRIIGQTSHGRSPHHRPRPFGFGIAGGGARMSIPDCAACVGARRAAGHADRAGGDEAAAMLARIAEPEALILTDVFGATPCNVAPAAGRWRAREGGHRRQRADAVACAVLCRRAAGRPGRRARWRVPRKARCRCTQRGRRTRPHARLTR